MIDNKVRGNIANESVQLKSNMYSLAAIDHKEIKKAKGDNKNTVDSHKT